jgi:cell division transport system permease protein
MSGSYERFSGRPPQPAQAAEFGPYDDPVTGPASTTGRPTSPFEPGDFGRPATFTEEAPPRDMYAPTRESKSQARKLKATAPVVPPGSVTGRSLTLVIAIMCFLACLTAGAVWMIKQSADAWLKDISSEVTVQVEPKEKGDIEKSVKDVAAYLERQPGIRSAKPLSLDESASLLEPWLGSTEALKALPVPRLIAIEIDRIEPPDLATVNAALQKDFKGVTLDDHRRWQQQIRAVTGSFALGGIAIFLLVAAATTAVIVSATKSAMASNRDIVEVLHFVGATDKFIAREFERHFLRLGIKSGIVGALLAMLVFLTMPAIMEMLGGGAISAVEMQRLIGTGSLDAAGYVVLGLVVVIIAGLCMVTSRVGVYRILNSQH